MNIEEILKPLGLPVIYRRFKQYKNTHLPSPPYLTWYIEEESFRGSDKRNRIAEKHVIIELFTVKKDIKTEQAIEKLLNFAFFDKWEDYDSTQGVFVISYEFDIIEKIKNE